MLILGIKGSNASTRLVEFNTLTTHPNLREALIPNAVLVRWYLTEL